MKRVLALALLLLALPAQAAPSPSLLDLEIAELDKQSRPAKIGRARKARLRAVLESDAATRSPRLRLLLATLQTLELAESAPESEWAPLLASIEGTVNDLLDQGLATVDAIDRTLLPNQRVRLVKPVVKRIPAKIPRGPRNAQQQALLAAWRSFLAYQRLTQGHLVRKLEAGWKRWLPEGRTLLTDYRTIRADLLAINLSDKIGRGRTLDRTRRFWKKWTATIRRHLRQTWADFSREEQKDLALSLYSLARKLAWVARRFHSVEELDWIP